MRIIPAIMSGGSGTRLWPLSTGARPKQFHRLGGGATMIQDTALRLSGKGAGIEFAAPIVIGNAQHGDLIARQLEEVGVVPAEIVLEPEGRDTAATAAIAAAAGRRLDPEALVLLAPADHVIADGEAFRSVIARAAATAADRITTFGIEPTGPETGFGYIQRGSAIADGVFEIARFREKPKREVAERYLAEGGHSWNAGIFLFAPHVLLAEFEPRADIREPALAAYAAARREGAFTHLPDSFRSAPKAPVDVAVMEQTSRGAVAPCSIGWADVGSWSELWRLSDKDARGNATSGAVVTIDANGNLIRSDGPTIAVAGVSDLLIIATGDAVLVLPKDRAQDVKALVEQVKARSPEQA